MERRSRNELMMMMMMMTLQETNDIRMMVK